MDKMKVIAESDNAVIIDLVRMIGIKNTATLVDLCGGGLLYIPKFDSLSKEERDKDIYNDFCTGMKYREVALKYSLSEATVRDIVNKQRKKVR